MKHKEMKREMSLSCAVKLFLCVITLSFFMVGNTAFAREMTQESNFLVDSGYDFYNRDSVEAFLAYESENAYFYLDHKYYDNLTDAQKTQVLYQVRGLGNEFDETIYPKTRGYFGEEWNPGIDSNSKIVILFDRLEYNVGGYFNPNDEYSKDRVVDGKSNEAEMIYLNPDFLKSDKVEGFLAHELQHMIYWNQKTRIRGVVDEVWLNEGRSELASSIIEDVLGKDFSTQTLSARRKDFLTSYTDSIVDWNNVNHDYSSVSIFMQYIKDHFGTSIFGSMNRISKTGLSGLDAVLRADKNIDLYSVFTNWTIANYVNDMDLDSSYGYKNTYLGIDFHVTPQLISDKNGDDIINLTDNLKNWSGGYYKVDVSGRKGDFFIDIAFNGDDVGRFSVPYIVNYSNGLQEVGFLKLNASQDGNEGVLFKNGTISSIVFIPSSQRIESVSSGGQVKEYGFTLDVKYEQAGNKVYPDGTLLRAKTEEKVYLLEGGQKRWITDAATFAYNGYDWNKIVLVDAVDLIPYPAGEDLKIKVSPICEGSLIQGDGPEVYLLENGKKRWIKDAQTFVAYNFDWSRIVRISNQELSNYENGEVLSRSIFANGALLRGSGPQVYLIENSQKRWIVSLAAFNKSNFKWSSVMQTSNENLAFYKDGSNIE